MYLVRFIIKIYHDARSTERQKPVCLRMCVCVCVCVIHYNQQVHGVGMKDQLLQMYTVERIRKNKWYMKLFTMLLNIKVLRLFIGKI